MLDCVVGCGIASSVTIHELLPRLATVFDHVQARNLNFHLFIVQVKFRLCHAEEMAQCVVRRLQPDATLFPFDLPNVLTPAFIRDIPASPENVS